MKLNKRIKEIREHIRKDEIEYDEEGRAVVKINITDAESLLSVYNDHGKEVISAETAHFINNVTKPLSPREDIHLKISCENYTEDKEQEYKDAIKNYYINEFAHRDIQLHRHLMISCVLFVVSILCFSFLYLMSRVNTPDVLYMLFDVISWVFAWEAIDQFFLQRYFLKVKQHKGLQIIYARISFRKLK